MAKIKLTKNELKKQKEDLKRYRRYLPMLQLKKKQLQLEIIKIHQAIQNTSSEVTSLRNRVLKWVDVFAERLSIEELCKLEKINTSSGNIAGIDMPVFLNVEFSQKPYDLLLTPLWIDKAILVEKEMITLKAKLLVYHKQVDILREELRIVNQRVNLFEKVKIPEAGETIRTIQIHLGEFQTAEVVRGKIAKAKLERRKEAMSA
ncbi:MAG: V-type ATP synthase subunit D [Candidatus Omnitrophica bacterium]|nr:V-type ATP synthase subunit D [Candidatus Omnitrophota bacterium]